MQACVTAERVLRSLGFHSDGERGIDPVGVVVGRDLINQRADRLGLDVDVDRLVLQRLEAADQLAELLADAQIVERDLLRLFHDTEQFAGHRQQREIVQRIHRVA